MAERKKTDEFSVIWNEDDRHRLKTEFNESSLISMKIIDLVKTQVSN
jgi:hypothetical protein